MLTTTHALVGAGLLTRREHSAKQIFAAWTGGLFPDLSVFAMVGVSRILPFPNGLWRAPDGLYWQEPWQTFSAISNSIPLYVTMLLLAGLMIARLDGRAAEWGKLLLLFAGAALLHVMADFAVHADDAHVHFWPFTDWRFHSPVSYWQRQYHGEIFGVIEAVAGVALAIALVVRFSSWRVRVATAVCVVPYFISLGMFF